MVHNRLFEALANRAVRAMVEFKPKVLSDVREPCFWSFHRASASSWSNKGKSSRAGERTVEFAGFGHPTFFEHFAPLALKRLEEMNVICIVYLMWSFSKAKVQNKELFDAVANFVAPQARNLDRCGLAMFCWNYAYIGDVNEEVFTRTAEDTLREERMAEMTPRDISAVAAAFAKANIFNRPLMQALAEHGCGLLKDGIEQKCYRKPIKSLAREIYEDDFSARDGRVDAFDMVSLADMLGALAEQQCVHQKFLDLADEYMVKGLQQSARDVGNFLRYPQVFLRTLIARARLSGDAKGKDLFAIAAPHVVRVLPQVGARDVARLISAWAVLGPRDPWVLAALSTRLQELLHGPTFGGLDSKDVEGTKWAVHELRISNRSLISQLDALQTST